MKAIFIALTGLLLALGAARAQTATPTSTSVDPRWGCDTVKDFPAPDLGEPQNIDNFKKQLIYYRCTAYEGDVAKVLAAAEKWVAARAPQVSRPAIVLDIDETSLTNWPPPSCRRPTSSTGGDSRPRRGRSLRPASVTPRTYRAGRSA